MAVNLLAPRAAPPPEPKKKKAFDLKKFAKLSPLALISAPVAAAAGGISALRSDLRAPVLGVGGATAGLVAGGPSGASAGFAGGQQLAGVANKAEGVLEKEPTQVAQGPGPAPVPVQTAPQRRVQTHQASAPQAISEGLIAASQLQDPEQKKQAMQALFPAFVKAARRPV